MTEAARAEALFDELSDWMPAALTSARGDAVATTSTLTEAVRRYAAAKALVDPSGAFENVVHFFAADGIGFEKQRVPALKRISDASRDELDSWCGQLGDIAMRLESESLG
jgi:hypothetical protein